MSQQPHYDVIVIGTGAGGGMAIHALCQAGAKVCALNGSRRLIPARDFRNHKQPYDLPFRGFGDPQKRKQWIGYMDNEYTEGIWEHDIAFTTAPGTEWTWRRCFAVGGKTNFWGRSSARFGDIDFRAASRDGYDVDWPVTYAEMASYYTRVERLIGVASTVQGRASNPDGDYLPPMQFRCLDRILECGAKKIGVPYLPDRIAQLTVPHAGHPACHYCGNCTEGCDVGAFFSTPWFFLPAAERSGHLELRTNALAKNIIAGEDGRAAGVAYIDRTTGQDIEVYGKAVVVAASCVESARILLNSRSRRWPEGIANSSGQAGRNLCDHLYGTTARGYLPQLRGQPAFPDNVSSSAVAWLPRWQNIGNPHEEQFIRGYSVYPEGGCAEFPDYFEEIDGFGHEFKREIKRRYPTPVSFYIQAPTQRSDANYVDIDPVIKDKYGIPAARLHFAWDRNTLRMWEHGKQVCEQLIRASGGEYRGHADAPDVPGTSLHETGTLRMGNDPKRFVTNRFGQTHDVPNLYICDASVFPNCTDKTTTLSVLAFSLRTTEYLIENLRQASLSPPAGSKRPAGNQMNRRNFLLTSLTTAAAAFGVENPKRTFPAESRARLAVSTYPFRRAIGSHGGGMTLAQFAQTVKPKLNVPGIEPWSHHFESTGAEYVNGLRGAFDQAGLHVVNIPVDVNVHLCGDPAQRKEGLDIWRKWVDTAVLLGSPSVRVHLPHGEAGDRIDCATSALRELSRYGASRNIVINLENDEPKTETPAKVAGVIDAVNSPFLRALPDFCNSMLVEDSQAFNDQAMRVLFPRAFNISHVKDQEADNGKVYRVDVGRIFSIAKQAGYKGYFSMEWEGEYKTPEDAYTGTQRLIDASLRYLG